MPTTTLTTHHLHGVVLSIVISTVFGAIWGLNGSAALAGGWRWIGASIVVLATTALLFTAYTFRRATSQLPAASTDPPINPFGTRSYRFAVIAEIIAIPLAGRVLSSNGYGDAIMPVVAIIVGLHFFGLIPAFRSWQFAWVGGAFCILALVALRLPAHLPASGAASGIALRQAVVGFGCALILWISVMPMIMTTYQQLAQRRTYR